MKFPCETPNPERDTETVAAIGRRVAELTEVDGTGIYISAGYVRCPNGPGFHGSFILKPDIIPVTDKAVLIVHWETESEALAHVRKVMEEMDGILKQYDLKPTATQPFNLN